MQSARLQLVSDVLASKTKRHVKSFIGGNQANDACRQSIFFVTVYTGQRSLIDTGDMSGTKTKIRKQTENGQPLACETFFSLQSVDSVWLKSIFQ